ncbi:MAG: hypothetical protein KKA10_05360 [Euryarchaeota archaeon]|nr:hypothetical protein [Euryarchaeota archaeon]
MRKNSIVRYYSELTLRTIYDLRWERRVVREMVRLGLADKWRSFAFHAPSQVRELIDNIGGNIPSQSEDGWREVLAKDMMENIEYYSNLKGWFDIPFFIYCDEFCRKCIRGYPPKECEMVCYRRG